MGVGRKGARAIGDAAAGALAWILRRQGREPEELRNARMLAVLLVFMGLYHPLALVLHAWLRPWMPLPQAAIALAAAATALIWGCFLLLRRGRFNLPVLLFLAGTLGILGWNYLRAGLGLQVGGQLITLLPPLLGALLLGRWVLWACAATLLAIIAGAAWTDIGRHFYDPVVLRSASLLAAQFAVGLLATALLFDRAAVLMRGYVSTLAERNAQLARTRDRLQLEMEERERSQRQLLHSQRVEAVGRLASGVAHDFNHLLALIQGYAERGRREQDVAQLHAMFEGVESASRRATAVSRRLLDFSRLEATRPEVFDAAALVGDLRPMLRQLFPPGVELRLELPSTLQPVLFDRGQLELMLFNLASNAAEAMPEGGLFTVSLPGPDPGRVEISARDTGCGMGGEEVARCREPFYTTKPAGQGTGLGLSVASDLAKAAGGALLVDSAPGQGTTVRIRLPRQAVPR
ncbi:sensor histidine kinase [Luteimonas sp. A537]